jgi:predicted nucleic acid-binding protein
LDEARASEISERLSVAELVLASCITLIECERVLIRAVAVDLLPEAVAAERRAVLARAAEHWIIFDLAAEVVERACRPFPAEPIRSLDAIHLATAVLARSVVPELVLLSLDERIRRSAAQMGFRVVPEEGA